MKKLIAIVFVLVIITGGVFVSLSHIISNKQPNTSEPKIAASVNQLQAADSTAASLKSLTFNKQADYDTLAKAIASIPTNDVVKDFNH